LQTVTHTFLLAGVEVELLPDRALLLRQSRTLILADVHWGKAATYRALGIPIPHGTTRTALDRLDTLLAATSAEQLIILGDLFHARAGMQDAMITELTAWRASHSALAITLVRGNHDYHAGDPPRALDIRCVDAPLHVGPFALHHHPTDDPSGYVLAGHVHPVVQLRGRAKQKVTLPCFAFGARGGLLPAFGEFTGGGVIDQRDYEQTFVLADDTVVPLRAGTAPYAL
jgi:uncharacterized protein